MHPTPAVPTRRSRSTRSRSRLETVLVVVTLAAATMLVVGVLVLGPGRHAQTATATPPATTAAVANDERVVIVGAGPAGAATAIELARHGVPSLVLSQRSAVPPPTLFNLLPPFTDRLAALGTGDSLTARLEATPGIQIEDRIAETSVTRTFSTPRVTARANRSRGSIDALLAALKPPTEEGADNRMWAKIDNPALTLALEQELRTRYKELVTFREYDQLVGVEQGDGWAGVAVTGTGTGGGAGGGAGAGGGSAGAGSAQPQQIRADFVVDATGTDLLRSSWRVYPERMHWLSARFAPFPDGDFTIRRTVSTDPTTGSRVITIVVPTRDRTMVLLQVATDAARLASDGRMQLMLRRARDVDVTVPMAPGKQPVAFTTQLSTSTEPARGRILKVGDSNRAPYFPTSTGAAAALVLDAPLAADAIAAAISHPESTSSIVTSYAAAVVSGSEQLLAASRRAMLGDLGRDPAAPAGKPELMVRDASGAWRPVIPES